MSKGLDNLEVITALIATSGDKRFSETKYANMLIDMSKRLKALDIIKTNRVDVGVFYAADNVNEYNSIMYELIERNYGKYLTQEEFDLLKEVLCDE